MKHVMTTFLHLVDENKCDSIELFVDFLADGIKDDTCGQASLVVRGGAHCGIFYSRSYNFFHAPGINQRQSRCFKELPSVLETYRRRVLSKRL